MEFIPFSKPSINQATCDEVVACLKSGWLTTGPRTKKFEEMLAEYFHNPNVTCLTSATAGLHLALATLDLKLGDEVITSAHTFVASLNTIVIAGAKPVLVDIDLNTRNMNVNLLEKAITPNTRAIMPVHIAGLPVDLDPLYALAKKYNLRVIEDAAQAVGTEYKGKKLGSFGDTQVFSFHPNKNMTSGEGGCVSTCDETLLKRINVLKFHGIDRDAFNRYGKTGSQEYDVIAPGFKYNMLDLQAAIGIHQLPQLDTFNKKRAKKASHYLQELKDVKALQLPGTPNFDCTHTWHVFTILIDPQRMSRGDFMQALKDKNVGTGLHYQPVSLYTYYRENYGFKPGDFPQAEYCGNTIVSLPLFPDLTESQQSYVIDSIKEVLA